MTGTHVFQRAALAAMLGVAGVVACSTSKSTTGMQAGPPTDIEAVSATSSTGVVSSAVTTKPLVKVTDANGVPVPGVDVNFAVTSGGGSVTGANKTTDNSGQAQVGSWTMGPNPGVNTLDATATGLNGSPVTFSVTASTNTSNFQIELIYLDAPTAAQQAAFDQAAARWSQVVIGDLSNVVVNVPANDCMVNEPALNRTVDDLLIYVSLTTIDGSGGVLGQAGPCRIRNSNLLTITGKMAFDIADLDDLEANGTLNDVILHEMGHVLGIGSLWTLKGLLADPRQGNPAADPHFTGASALAAFNGSNGGVAYVASQKIPVENTGGSGTWDSHWRESVFKSELMTGFISGTGNPMSLTTIQSLTDLGYAVSGATADPFDWQTAIRAATSSRPTLYLGDDVVKGPYKRVDDRPQQ